MLTETGIRRSQRTNPSLGGSNIKIIAKSSTSAELKNNRRFGNDFRSVLLASFIAAVVLYPLDILRALQMANAGEKVGLSVRQLISEFRRSHGVSGFFSQGLVPEIFRATWTRFFKFALFPITLDALSAMELFSGFSDTSLKILSAIVSGIPESACIMPFEIAKVQLQLDTQGVFKNSLSQALSAAYTKHGLWRLLTVGFFPVFYRQAGWSAG